MMTFKKSALAFVAMTTVAITTVACGSKKSSTTPPGGTVVTKGDDSPSSLACNGTNSDPATHNSNLSIKVHTVVQPLTGSTFPALPGAHVAVYNVATGTTSGMAVTTSSNALGLLTLKDSTRYAFKVTHAPNGSTSYKDTYQFNSLTPTVSSAASFVFNLRMIDSTLYSAFIGLIGLQATDVMGTTQVAAAVTDCDGDMLKHVQVDTINRCQGHTTFPCVAYFSNGAPSPNATETDASGQFIVAGVPAGAPFTVHLKGVITSGTAAVELGKLTIYGEADSVALGTTEPLAP